MVDISEASLFSFDVTINVSYSMLHLYFQLLFFQEFKQSPSKDLP